MNSLDTALNVLAATSWRIGLLIVLCLGSRRLGRGRIPAAAVFAVWLVLAGALLVPVGIPARWSPFGLVPRIGTAVTPPAALPVPLVQGSEFGVAPLGTLTLPEVTGLAVAPVAIAVHQPSLMDRLEEIPASRWATLVWLAGVAVLVLRRAAAVMIFSRKLRRSLAPADVRTASAVERCRELLGIQGEVTSGVTSLVETPALHGIFAPRLLMPVGMAERLTDEELELVVLHELGHVRRRDLLAQTLIHAAAVLHWFNPLAWLAAHAARADCEHACDEFVLGRVEEGRREDYGAVLLKVVGLGAGPGRLPAVLGIFEGKKQLQRRIHLIAGYSSPHWIKSFAGAVLLLVIALVGLTRESVGQQPPVASATTEIAPALDERGKKVSQTSEIPQAQIGPNGVVAPVIRAVADIPVLRATVLDSAGETFLVDGVRLNQDEVLRRFQNFVRQNASASIELTGEANVEFSIASETLQKFGTIRPGVRTVLSSMRMVSTSAQRETVPMSFTLFVTRITFSWDESTKLVDSTTPSSTATIPVSSVATPARTGANIDDYFAAKRSIATPQGWVMNEEASAKVGPYRISADEIVMGTDGIVRFSGEVKVRAASQSFKATGLEVATEEGRRQVSATSLTFDSYRVSAMRLKLNQTGDAFTGEGDATIQVGTETIRATGLTGDFESKALTLQTAAFGDSEISAEKIIVDLQARTLTTTGATSVRNAGITSKANGMSMHLVQDGVVPTVAPVPALLAQRQPMENPQWSVTPPGWNGATVYRGPITDAANAAVTAASVSAPTLGALAPVAQPAATAAAAPESGQAGRRVLAEMGPNGVTFRRPVAADVSNVPAVPSVASSSIRLIAISPVRVQVNLRNADGSDGAVVLANTEIQAGDSRVVPWNTALNLTATEGANLQLEVDGKRVGVGFTGYNKGWLPAPDDATRQISGAIPVPAADSDSVSKPMVVAELNKLLAAQEPNPLTNDGAIATLKAAAAQHSTDGQFDFQLANIYYNLGRVDEAIASVREAIRKGVPGREPTMRLSEAYYLYSAKRYSEASAAATKGLALPNLPSNVANQLEQLRDASDASTKGKPVSAVDSGNPTHVVAAVAAGGTGGALLPAAVSASPAAGLAVFVNADGSILFQGAQVTMDELSARLKKVAAESVPARPTVQVRADPSTSYAFVIRVIDALKQAGLTNMDLSTTPPRSAPVNNGGRLVLEAKDVPPQYTVINREFVDALGITPMQETVTSATDRIRQDPSTLVVARVNDTAITAADVNQAMGDSIRGIRAVARDQKDYAEKVAQAQEVVIKNLIDRELVIQEFRMVKPGEKEARKIPDSYLDQEIAAQEHDKFGDDRAKFLAYIESLGLTRDQYRKKIEDDIIFRYMLGQFRQAQAAGAAPENKTPAQLRDESVQQRDDWLKSLRAKAQVQRF